MNIEELMLQYELGNMAKAEFIKLMHTHHRMLFDYSKFICDRDIQKIEITDNSVVMTSRKLGIKIICDEQDYRIAPVEILNFQEYEKQDSDMIFRLVNDKDTLLDIGANIGWYSIGLSKAKNNLNIHAFEPIPKTYEYLVANVRLNGLTNIHIHKHGLSNETSEVPFYYYPEGSGNASMSNLAANMNSIEIKLQVIPLDFFVKRHGIDKVDFIKCDVEGAELLVFQGGRDTIQRDKPIVFSEILRKWSAKFGYHPNDIISFFTELGYGCFTVKEKKLSRFLKVDENTIDTNYFFLHEGAHKQIIDSY